MKTNSPASAGASRLFHSMVVLGGSLAAACGGSVEPGGSASGGSGGPGGAGPDPTGGSGGTGGTPVVSTGGVAATGGSSTVPVPVFECRPAQWDCSTVAPSCNYPESDFYLPAESECSCDETKPAGPSDCEADEDFVCRGAGRLDTGEALETRVPFDCACVPRDESCTSHCEWAELVSDCGTEDGPRSIVCGCAVVILR